MISAEYYELVYMLIIIAFAIPVCNRYVSYTCARAKNGAKEPIGKSLWFTILIICYIGVRPNSPRFADGPGYWYGILDHRWEYYTMEEVSNQFATKYLMSTMSSLHVDPRIGFFVFAIIMYGFALVAMRKFFPKDTLIAMILYCGTFCVFGGAVNGIKNGMALSVFLCALAYWDKWKVYIPLLLLSLGFHHSMQLSVAAFILCKLYKNTKHYCLLWILGIIIASAHISYFQILFAGYTDESGRGYLITNSDSWVTGFRPDFILYSAVPILIGWWITKKIKIPLSNKYRFCFNTYLVMNTVWMLCMYSAYTNRIAALSWAIFPILLLYPFLNIQLGGRQYKYVTWVVWGQLSFTMFMTLLSLKSV